MEVSKSEQKIWIRTTLSTLICKKADDKILLHSKKMYFQSISLLYSGTFETWKFWKHENMKILKEQLDVSIWFEKGKKNGFILQDIAYNNPERSSVKTTYASVNFL